MGHGLYTSVSTPQLMSYPTLPDDEKHSFTVIEHQNNIREKIGWLQGVCRLLGSVPLPNKSR